LTAMMQTLVGSGVRVKTPPPICTMRLEISLPAGMSSWPLMSQA
jgi:hypothetical protein